MLGRLPLPPLGPAVRPRIAALLVLLAVLIVAGRAFGGPPGRPQPVALPAGTLEFRALDVGQGDALLLRLDGRTLMVDAGPDGATVRERVLPRFVALGIERIDQLVLTHADADHIGGAADLLCAVEIGRLVLADVPAAHPLLAEIRRLADERGVQVRLVGRGAEIDWHPRVETQVLHPRAGAVGDDNERSIVLRLTYGDAALLLTADVERKTETQLLEIGAPLDADVLKVAHHGAAGSTSEAFVRAVNPQIAVVAAGRDNAFAHPRETALQRLLAHGTQVFRTDLAGEVVVRTDGHRISVALERG